MIDSSRFARHILQLSQNGFLTLQKSFLTRLTQNANVNNFTDRTHHCGQLTSDDIGKRVSLCGWVKYTRFNNKIISLRDSYGTVQCIVDKGKLTKSFRKAAIHNESVLKVSGTVQARPAEQRNEYQPLGDIEVLVDDVDLLSAAKIDLPILTRETDPEQSVANRLRYRYLDIRRESLQEALRFRSKVCQIFRKSLQHLEFVECETPTLFRRTPGGANEFIVPTQTPSLFYGLTQSPQQLKQLLMIGGLDRYFQICRCYRDESGRSDRQPEFTQLDIELSFTSQEHVIGLVNQLMKDLFQELGHATDIDTEYANIFDEHGSVQQIPFQEALEKYGSDKPDARFGWLLEDTNKDGIGFKVPRVVCSKLIRQIFDDLQTDAKNPNASHELSTTSTANTTSVFMRSKTDGTRKLMGQLRVKLAAYLQKEGEQIYDKKFKLLWVTDFPLFIQKEGTDNLESNHHPFTAPTIDTAQFLSSDPLKVIAQHYDLVLNGQEIAGGSIRIHKPELQQFIFNDILKIPSHTFEYFIEALSSGCPPHGGIAVGLDRFVAILLNKDSIRDVIAFPKSSSGRDSMAACPHKIDAETLAMYHLNSGANISR